MRHTYLLNYVCVRVCIHIQQPSKPLRTRAVSSSNFCDASSLRFPRLVFILPRARSGYVPRHERDSQAFMRISIYSDTLRVLFPDDEGRALLTTITARLMKRSACAFKSRLHRHRSSLDLLGCSLVESFAS